MDGSYIQIQHVSCHWDAVDSLRYTMSGNEMIAGAKDHRRIHDSGSLGSDLRFAWIHAQLE